MTLAEAYRQSALIEAAYDMLDLSDPSKVAMPSGFKLLDVITANDFGMGVRPFGLVAEDQRDGQLSIALRGSKIWRDWLENVRFLMRQAPGRVGMVENGFGGVFDSLATLSGRPIPKVTRGAAHSLGCAVLAYLAGQLGGVDLCLLGSPEPGDEVLVQWVLAQVTSVLNLQNPHDVVTDAPGRFLGYRDVGTVTHLPFGDVGLLDVEGNHALANYRAALRILANLPLAA